MGIQLFILLLVSLSTAAGQQNEDVPYCSNTLSQYEIIEEKALRELITQDLNTTFGKEPHSILKLLQYITNNKLPLEELIDHACIRLKAFSSTYINSLIAIFIFALAYCCFRIKNYKFSAYLQKFEKKEVYVKVIAILLVVACLFAMFQSLRGIAEGSKQRKSFNHILCKNFDGIGPSGSANGYEAFEAQILKLQKTEINNLKTIRPALNVLKTKKQPLRIAKFIQNSLAKQFLEGKYATELKEAIKVLEVTLQYSKSGIVDCLKETHSVVSYFSNFIFAMRASNRALYNYGLHSGNFQQIISLSTVFVQLFYLCVAAVSLTVLIAVTMFITKSKIIIRNSHWLYYFLIITAFTCFCIFLLSTCIIPGLLWVNDGYRYVSEAQVHLSQEFQPLNKVDLKIIEIAALIFPFNKTLTQVHQGSCLRSISSFSNITLPYQSKKETYMYDLFNQSLIYIKDVVKKQEIGKLLKSEAAREPIATYIANVHQALGVVLDSTQEFDAVHQTKFWISLSDVVETFFLLIPNRLYIIRQISGSLSILLFVILLLYLLFESIIARMGLLKSEKLSQRKRSEELRMNSIPISEQAIQQ